MILATALMVSLAGCSAPQQPQPQRPVNFDNLLEGQQIIERVLPPATYDVRADITRHTSQMQRAILARMKQPSDFAGKTCDLRIKFNRNAQAESVKNMGGDPALCNDVMLAVSKANFPQFENEGVYQLLKEATLSLKF